MPSTVIEAVSSLFPSERQVGCNIVLALMSAVYVRVWPCVSSPHPSLVQVTVAVAPLPSHCQSILS